MRRYRVAGSSCASGSPADSSKPSDASHRCRRTRAMASTKVGDGLSYQAALRWVMGCRFCNAWAARVVQSSEGSSVTFTASDAETVSIPTVERHSPNDGSVTVTVSTGTGYAVGTPSSANTVITRKRIPPATPEPPTVTGLTTTSVRAEWTKPSSELPITGYSVRHRPVAGIRMVGAAHGQQQDQRDHRRADRRHRVPGAGDGNHQRQRQPVVAPRNRSHAGPHALDIQRTRCRDRGRSRCLRRDTVAGDAGQVRR